MSTHLHSEKEDEAKLVSLSTSLWNRENVLDGTSDPSAVASGSI